MEASISALKPDIVRIQRVFSSARAAYTSPSSVHPVHIQSSFFMCVAECRRVPGSASVCPARPSHEISPPLVVQAEASIRLNSSSNEVIRKSIRSYSTRAARIASASHASLIRRRPRGRARYRAEMMSQRHPGINTAMSGTIVGRGFRFGDPLDIRLECAFHVWAL